MSEKTEKATPYKLQKAKEQGRVSKSMEINTCVFLFALCACIAALWPSCLSQIEKLLQHLLILSARIAFNADSISQLQQFLLTRLLYVWLPFALAGIVAISLASIAQTGFVWSVTPLVPDFKRLDISKGFKRLFSTKSLFEAGKNSMKLVLITLLLTVSLRCELPALLHFMALNPQQILPQLMHLIIKIMLQCIALLSVLACIDSLYTRWKYAKDNRMSKQELKDEYRQREGDPKIKMKIKQLQQQLRQKTASIEAVKNADVVITNPTHLAIALQYERGSMPAPKVVCKAQGKLAQQVRQIAARHRIPVIENKRFARALFATTDCNQWIRKEHFPVAAQIFCELYQQRTQAS